MLPWPVLDGSCWKQALCQAVRALGFVSLLKPEGRVLVAQAPPAAAMCGVGPGAGRPQLPACERSNPSGCQLRAPLGCPEVPSRALAARPGIPLAKSPRCSTASP